MGKKLILYRGMIIMTKLIKKSSHWEIYVEVGNDWGVPSYYETREYQSREELDKALEDMNYYDIPHKIKEVAEYEIDYGYED